MSADGAFGFSGTSEPSRKPFGRSKGSRAGSSGSTAHAASGSRTRKLRPAQESPYGPVVGGSGGSDYGYGFSQDYEDESNGPPGYPDADPPVVSPEKGSKLPEDSAGLARSIVLRHLAMAPKSRHQLAQKLRERDIPDDVAGAVLDRFEEVQLIDDAEFAGMWVRSRAQTRSLARSVLKRELADRGIHPDLAEDALAQVTDEDERAAAEQVIRRKMRAGIDLADRKIRDRETRKLVGVLARKGYNPGLAFSLVRDIMDAGRGSDDCGLAAGPPYA
ncbi:SOS response regulatory protein OraA/RecX [Arthrobacter sp. CAN_A214]|uniref:regulatory protein RecX n=1 Tax=Arthrobacter sp. CAN_A214 TaxID=2787720 RepID=UPI001A2E76BE